MGKCSSGVIPSLSCLSLLPQEELQADDHWAGGRYELNPYGVVSLSGANFKDYQDYDISVTLKLPNSPTNLARGNFMLALYLLDSPHAQASKTAVSAATAATPMPTTVPAPQSVLTAKNILFTSTRPAIMPYTDPLVSLAKRLLLLAYHIFVPCSETTRLVVPMAERLEFVPGKMMPTSLVLDVQAGQALQVYDVLVTITAQLGGLRWFMHTWWVTSFVLFTSLFWLSEVFFLALTALAGKVLWGVVFGGGKGAGPHPGTTKQEEAGRDPRIKQEGGHGYGKSIEDVPMTFPTSSQQPPLRYDPEPGDVGGGAATPQQQAQGDVGGEADVEDEAFGDDYLYREEDEDVHGRDSGIGTSFSERDGPGGGSVRRRTSMKRTG
jgi:seipin